MDRMNQPPSRDEVAARFRALIANEQTREAVSDWAGPWFSQLDEIADPKVAEAIQLLRMADLPTTNRPYLYGPEDFEAWLKELAGGVGGTPPTDDA